MIKLNLYHKADSHRLSQSIINDRLVAEFHIKEEPRYFVSTMLEMVFQMSNHISYAWDDLENGPIHPDVTMLLRTVPNTNRSTSIGDYIVIHFADGSMEKWVCATIGWKKADLNRRILS